MQWIESTLPTGDAMLDHANISKRVPRIIPN